MDVFFVCLIFVPNKILIHILIHIKGKVNVPRGGIFMPLLCDPHWDTRQHPSDRGDVELADFHDVNGKTGLRQMRGLSGSRPLPYRPAGCPSE